MVFFFVEAPLFGVSKVANQKREEMRIEAESNVAVPISSQQGVSDEDFYGPALPPGFSMF